MRRADLILLVLALLVLPATAAGEGPYVVGSEDDPNEGDGGIDLGPQHAEVVLIRSHRYSERFSVEAVAVSPDGKEIAALSRVSREGPKAWEFSTGRPLNLPPMAAGAVTLAYGSEMREVAVAVQGDVLADDPGGVDLLDLKSGKGPRLPGGDEARDLAFSPDDRVLLAATADGLVGWDLAGGRELEVVRVPGGADMVAFISPSQVIVGGGGGAILMRVELEDGRVAESWEGRGTRAACVSPDGKLVAIAGVDAIRILDLQGGGEPQRVPIEGEVAALDWGASGLVLAAGTTTGEVFVFGVRGVPGLSSGSTSLSGDRRESQEEARSGGDRARRGGGRTAEAAGGGRRGDEPADRGGRDDRSSDRDDDRERDGWDDPFSRERQDERSSSGTVTAKPPEEPRVELVGEVKVFVLKSFGNDPRTSGKLEKSLRGNIKRLEPCWKREARKGNPMTGELILPMTVSAEGEGLGFGDPASDSIGSEKLLECLGEKLRGNLFPPGLGSLEVEMTLILKEELVQ
jgi:hypothetical protein